MALMLGAVYESKIVGNWKFGKKQKRGTKKKGETLSISPTGPKTGNNLA